MQMTSMTARSFATFGEDSPPIADLSEVNVIVGPNGSGKSNLLKAVGFVGSAFGAPPAYARPYVQREDVNRSIGLDISVRLRKVEARKAMIAATLGFDEVHGAGPPLNLHAATRAVRDVLRQSATSSGRCLTVTSTSALLVGRGTCKR